MGSRHHTMNGAETPGNQEIENAHFTAGGGEHGKGKI
jgi:hypothetical protein